MITKIKVAGYRLLNEFSADFGALTVVIGANAVGKSTLLDFIQFVAQCVEYPINNVLGWHWGMPSLLNASGTNRRLSWTISFTRPKGGFWEQMPLEADRLLDYEVVLQSDALGQASAQYEVLRASLPRPGHTEPLKFLEATPYRKHLYDHTQHQLISFDQAVSQQSTPSIPANGVSVPSQAQEPATLLSQIRFLNEFPIPSFVRLYLATMWVYPGFDITRYSSIRTKPAEIKPVVTLFANGENLGTVLHEILNRYEYRNAANDLREFLKAAYPTFEEIHCDTTYGTPPQVLVRVREKGMPRSMEMWELSDGMLRFLCLATALLNPSSVPLIAIDEPEAGFHPRLLPIVADMIKTGSEHNQVLITTHSPDLLNRFDINDIAVMKRDEDSAKANWFRPSSRESLVKMLKEVMGETLGDLHRSGELESMA